MKHPKLKLSSKSQSLTLHLHPDADACDELGFRGFGWVIATVNDGLGTLDIQSDWGAWSYRWHADGFGERETLTRFLAGKHGCTTRCILPDKTIEVRPCSDTETWDYVAGKLLVSGKRYEWDQAASILEVKREIIKGRRDLTFSKAEARFLWREIDELENASCYEDFHHVIEDLLSPLMRYVHGDVYEAFHRTMASQDYLRLVGTILPGIGKALADHVAELKAVTP